MTQMADSLRDVADEMKTRRESKAHEREQTARQNLTPKLPDDPQERAIAILEQDATLSDNEMIQVIDYFMADRDLARVYATLQTSRARTSFLESRLAKLRGEAM
jgi:hypothetical protein